MFIYTWPECSRTNSRRFTPCISQIIRFMLKALADKKCLSKTRPCAPGSALPTCTTTMPWFFYYPYWSLVCSTTTGAFATAWSNCWAGWGKISGVSGKMSSETASEDDNFGTEQSFKSIMATFGSPYSSPSGEIIVQRHFQQFFLTQGGVDCV